MNQLTDKRFASLPQGIVLYGGTGQAKVNREIIELRGSKVVAVVDDTQGITAPFSDVPLLSGVPELLNWMGTQDRSKLGYVVSIGNPHAAARLDLHHKLQALGLKAVTLVHPQAFVSQSASVGSGCQIMAGAVVGVDVKMGISCIINTNATVDHECVLGDGVGVAPGATLCGLVTVENGAWICAGATVLPRLSIGTQSVVGAGAVVTGSVSSHQTVIGVPAREIVCR